MFLSTGVYPSKPALRDDIGSKEPLVIMGNEATGIVRGFEDENGKIEHSLKIGDVGKSIPNQEISLALRY